MSVKVYVPRDSAALSVGAEGVARAIASEASSRGLDITLVRNGSRGMFWLEPLVEVETPSGRIAYGPVDAADSGMRIRARVVRSSRCAGRVFTTNFAASPLKSRQYPATSARCTRPYSRDRHAIPVRDRARRLKHADLLRHQVDMGRDSQGTSGTGPAIRASGRPLRYLRSRCP